MSVESLAAVLHHSRAKGTAKLVLLGIANHDGDGGAWVGVAKLAVYANVDERSVQRALQKLVSLGELVIHTQQGGTHLTSNHLRPNRYDVAVTCPPWCDRTTQHRDTRKSRQANLVPLSSAVHRGDASVTPPSGRKRKGVTPVSPHPVTPVSPEPSSRTETNEVGTQVKDARVMCEVCSAPRHVCIERQAVVKPEDRHAFKAVSRASR